MSELNDKGVKPKFKVPSELQQHIWEWVRGAKWYVTMTGYQGEHTSDLSLEEHYMEDEDEVIAGIVTEVLEWYLQSPKGWFDQYGNPVKMPDLLSEVKVKLNE